MIVFAREAAATGVTGVTCPVMVNVREAEPEVSVTGVEETVSPATENTTEPAGVDAPEGPLTVAEIVTESLYWPLTDETVTVGTALLIVSVPGA